MERQFLEAKIARIRAGFRQMELAVKTGIPVAYVSFYENRLLKPSAERARKLNRILGAKVYDEK